MIFKPFYYYDTGCAAYLFGCGTLGKCTVVDAHEDDISAYVVSRCCTHRATRRRASVWS